MTISRIIQITIYYVVVLTAPCSTAFNNFGNMRTIGSIHISPGDGNMFRRGSIHRQTMNGVTSRTRRLQSTALRLSFSMNSPLFSNDCMIRGDTNVNHRYSASDWLHNVFSLRRSSVLREIRNPVITAALWSTLVSIVFRIFKSSSSNILQKVARDMCIGSTVHSFLVSSLGLLLVFRTNSAYQRFSEGRRIWEDIHSISRNFNRMLNLYETDITPKRQQRVQNLLAAFPYLLRHHIRPRCLKCTDAAANGEHGLLLHEPPLPAVETRHEGDKLCPSSNKPRECWVDKRKLPWCLLPSETLSQCGNALNRPLWVCDRMAKELTSVKYNDNFTSRERLALLGHVDKLSKAIGECERIHQTAVPLNYARHSLRGLSLWLFTLPFALVEQLGVVLTGPVVGVVAWLMFGIYQIGYSIEDPFQRTLRLSRLCDAIKKDVLGDDGNTAFMLEEREEEKVGRKGFEFEFLNDIRKDDFFVEIPEIVKYQGDKSDVRVGKMM